MKKTSTFLAAFLFSAGMAFAQSNDASVTQNTNNSEVSVDQIGSSNSADVTQVFGQHHDATILQNGSNNSLDLFQDNTNTYSNIEQLGESNSADIFQRSRQFAGRTVQVSVIELTQDGAQNSADIRQDAESGSGSQTNVFSGLQQGTGNSIYADQNREAGLAGSANSIDIEQYGDRNSASATQDGESNTANITQGEFGGSEDSEVSFEQIGAGNYFSATQTRSINNTVYGTQDGSDNYYRVSMRGSNNDVTMDMEGDANRGSWNISSLGWPHQPTGNSLSIDVVGDGNISTGSIAGDYNEVTLVQYGSDNSIGSSWHTNDGVSIAGDFNTVDISQMSDNNSASVAVTGNGNTSTISQN